MKESHDNLEPLKIGGSAYSRRNREDMEAEGGEVRPVNVGAKPKTMIEQQSRFLTAHPEKARSLSAKPEKKERV
jgi:hypothetical protein